MNISFTTKKDYLDVKDYRYTGTFSIALSLVNTVDVKADDFKAG